MNRFKKTMLALATTGCLAFSSGAHAIAFDLSTSSTALTPGSGYGVDTGNNPENGGSLLDVLFTSLSGTQSFVLNAINDTFTFLVGTVNFRETDAGSGSNAGIRSNEQDNLGVSASFSFTNPLNVIQSVTATGSATLGLISDDAVDYILNWDPVFVNFGTGGQFKIDLEDLSFAKNGSKDQKATVTLVALPTTTAGSNPTPGGSTPATLPPQTGDVPEPATLALLGFGLLGLGCSRRKRAA